MKVEKAFEHCESSTWMICLFLPKYLMILTGCIGVADNWKWFDSGGKCIRHVWTGGCTIAHPTWINQRVVWFPNPLAAGIFPSQDLPSEAHKLHTNTKTKFSTQTSSTQTKNRVSFETEVGPVNSVRKCVFGTCTVSWHYTQDNWIVLIPCGWIEAFQPLCPQHS